MIVGEQRFLMVDAQFDLINSSGFLAPSCSLFVSHGRGCDSGAMAVLAVHGLV